MSNLITTYPTPVPFGELTPSPVPHDIVPGIISEYSAAVANSIQVPFELPLINVFGAIAAVAQRKFRVQVHAGYSEPVNIFALAILPPGERKSAAKDLCRFPLLAWEAEEQRRIAAEIKHAQAAKLVQEEASRSLLATAKKCQTPEERDILASQIMTLNDEIASLPIAPRLLADDTTPEALAALMASHGQRIAMIEAEGGFFDTLAGRYSSGVPNLDAVLKSWSGEAVRIDRRHTDSILLDDPSLTLILSAQPDVLIGTAQTPSFRGRGLLGRLLFLLPQSLVGSRVIETVPVPDGLKNQYNFMLRHLLELPWNIDSQGEQVPYQLSLEGDAKAEWIKFATLVEQSLAEGASMAAIRDWGGKLPGQVLRLAGLCHLTLFDMPQNHLINTDTMKGIISLAHILMEHTKAAFSLMGADDAIECAKTIQKWLIDERLETFTAKSCLDKVKGKWPKMSLVNPGLTILEERCFIFPKDQENLGRGRPSRIYIVNPIIHGVKS